MADDVDIEQLKLSELICPEFNYETYCNKIDHDKKLTPNEKAYAKDILDLHSTLVDVNQRILRYKREQPRLAEELDIIHTAAGTNTELSASSHPAMHKMIQDTWEKTKQHYSQAIQGYNSKFKVSETEYPNCMPQVALFLTDSIQAAAWFDDKNAPCVGVSKGFLNLPCEEQRAIILHEHAHLMEPALEEMKPDDYAKEADARNKSSQNAFSRTKELQADTFAATLGDGDALLRALTKTEELFRGFQKSFSLKQRYEEILMPTIYQAAHSSGFDIDIEQCANFSSNITFWINALIKEIQIGENVTATHNDADEAPSHPTMEERTYNVHTLQQKHQVEQPDADKSWVASLEGIRGRKLC